MTTTLITGSNKGLGFETARRLVAAGHTVWVGARDQRKAQQAAEALGASAVQIDITDDDSAAAAAAVVESRGDGLDVLVNNAGIAGGRYTADQVTAEDFAALYDTNVFGIVRTMRAFAPLLQRSSNGVVVNVGSGLGSLTRVSDPDRFESGWLSLAYASAKSAVSMLTLQYAHAFPELRINVVDPGFTATDLNGHRGTQTVRQGAEPIVAAALIGPDGPTGTFIGADGPVPW
jgi:NAD(P)-dependent dehydrogenase (short-subunit alcohol dehydrogenase family)